jgi:tetratricopeptide (TPR) repeat protein
MLVLIPFSGNKLNRVKDNFPSEPKLPLHISWAVSTGAFSESPLFGTGPASYQYNYTRYRPVEFNNSEDWNYRFTSANNEFLRALGEWGILGLAALIFLTFSIVAIVRKFLISTEKLGGKGPKEVLLPSFAVGLFISAALLFISSSTLISIVITLMLLASFLALSENQKELELPDRFKVKLFGDKKVDILPILGLVIFLATSFYIGRKAVEAVSADYYHRLALTQASRDGGKTYEYLQKAEELNPYIDLYRIDMAQTNLALANLIVAQKGPTEENPEGNLTQEDIDTIRILLSQAINEAKIATELSPRSSRNWQVLGTIYKNITGISDNALTLSLDAYGRALENDPFNPFLRSQIAEVYYFVENYGQAVKFYNEAIKLKPDYVKGYYNLALTLRDSGDIQGAKENAEKAVELLRNDLSEDEKIRTSELLKQAWVKDFSLATDLLDEIKDTVEMNSSDNVSEFKNSSLPDLELSEPQEAIGI